MQFGWQTLATHASPVGQSEAVAQLLAQALVVPMVTQVAPSPQVLEVAQALLQVPWVAPLGMMQVRLGSRKQSATDLQGTPSVALAGLPVLVSVVPPPSLGHGVPSPQLAKPPLVLLEHPTVRAITPNANPIQRWNIWYSR